MIMIHKFIYLGTFRLFI